jgi:hypothetical protein
MIVIGTLVYNEILVIPWMGFNQYTQKAIDGRKEALKEY